MRVCTALRAAAVLAAPLWLSAAAAAAAAADAPVMRASAFAYMPDNLNYFEDSDVVLFHDYVEGLVYRSEDAGAHWDKVTSIPDQQAARLVMHAFHPERAYVLTDGIVHYRTEDRGKTWWPFLTDAELSLFQYDVLTFHAGDPDRIIFNGMDFDVASFSEVAMYTTDGFRSDARFLRGNTAGCWWARSAPHFTTGAADLDASRILCIVRDAQSPFKQDQRLLVSDNFFSAAPGSNSAGAIQEFEPNLDTARPVQGIVNLAAVQRYLLVAATSRHTDEMALFVTDDTLAWHRAVFPADHRVNQEAYTVLESTNYSIQIDVMDGRPADPTGVLFTSNSNGTFFTRNVDYTNRNQRGHVDFEKISGIQGIFLVNRVANGAEVRDARAAKRVVTEITFDDGRTFAPVTLAGGNGGERQRLHLHSVTDLHNVGRVFSSPAPGLVMGVGNTGDALGAYADGDLYVSDDAGVSWTAGPRGPHKYEFGDQGSVLLAVRDADAVGEVTYSLDHGQTWRTAALPDGLALRPYILTTTQDSTSLKFLLVGESAAGWHIVAIDFEGLHEATCQAGDLEDWWARVDEEGRPTCLMGHKQKYHRRKKDAACFLRREFQDPVVETEDCECGDADFECDYNFRRSADGTRCEAAGPIVPPEGACGPGAKAEDVFLGTSGWRLIPGNTCRRRRTGGGPQKDDPVEHTCAEAVQPPSGPASGRVTNTVVDFAALAGGYDTFEKHYLERGDSSSAAGREEAIIMRPVDSERGVGGPIFVTSDQGRTWTRPSVLDEAGVWAIVPHAYFKEVVFLATTHERVLYTVDSGRQWHEFRAPYAPDVASGLAPLGFHPDKKDWLLWTGTKCEAGTGACYRETSLSRDRGDNWVTLLRYVERCEFIGSSAYKARPAEAVLCLARAREEAATGGGGGDGGGGDGGGDDGDNPLQLVSSTDWFESKTVHAEHVRGFATMAEFIVVAAEEVATHGLRALASLDGATFAEAQFPVNVAVPEQHEYTVLDSSTHAVNLFVATETGRDRRYGTLLKSNSNGTSYVLSRADVNCDNRYYVDFEKVLGLEGVVLVNVVANAGALSDGKATQKELQTVISHNDGAEWAYLPPPAADVNGKAYGCTPRRGKGAAEGGDERCALHIHGYTERADHRKTFSSEGAVGLLFGVGNVGARLGRIEDEGETDTFMTTDAGLTWRNVKKGAWTWQFGDQGSIVVLVPRFGTTTAVAYTTDEGATWTDHVFSDEPVVVLDVTTLRTGASRAFVVWCRRPGDGSLFTVHLDFAGLTERPCAHDAADAAASDYYLWSPSHPRMPASQCLFGHVAQYLRKKPDRACYNGHRMQHVYNLQNCSCTRRDYECDYNYQLDNHGQCALVPGLAPLSKAAWCAAHPDAVDYYPPTGFRRVPLTTCEGGDQYDRLAAPEPCPGHEDEYLDRHGGGRGGGGGGLRGWALVLVAVVLPVAVAAAAGTWVYRHWSGKIGAIRLGDHGQPARFAVDSNAPFVKYPVMAAAAVVAVARTLPLLAAALGRYVTGVVDRFTGRRSYVSSGAWHWLMSLGSGGGGSGGAARRFTTRDSFARGRGDYAIVDEDEGELLGDDSDEEV